MSMNPSTVVSTRGLKPCQDQPVPRDDFRNFRFSPDHGGRFCGEDDVNLLPRRAQADDLLQKGDELTAGVAGSGFAVDANGGGIEGCISGEGAAAVVLKAVAFGASRRERQVGIKTNQGLNGGLLIDTEHGCGLGVGADRGRGCRRLWFRTRGCYRCEPVAMEHSSPCGCFCVARRLMTTCMQRERALGRECRFPRSPSAKSLSLGAIPAGRLAQGNGRGSPAATEVWFGIAIAAVLTDSPFWDARVPSPDSCVPRGKPQIPARSAHLV